MRNHTNVLTAFRFADGISLSQLKESNSKSNNTLSEAERNSLVKRSKSRTPIKRQLTWPV